MTNQYAATFGQRLRELRKAKCLSQKALAGLAGIDFTYLSKVETGNMDPPAEGTIRKLANALGTDADELIRLAGKVPKDLGRVVSQSCMAATLLRAMQKDELSEADIAEFLNSRKTKKDVRE